MNAKVAAGVMIEVVVVVDKEEDEVVDDGQLE